MPRRKNSRISQQQIARELDVSQALVSMVLNGRRSGISEASYNQIWKYALEHGYRPRGMNTEIARNNEESHRSVGYILRAPLELAIKSNFFNYVHQGLHNRVSTSDVQTMFLGSEVKLDPAALVKRVDSDRSLIGLVVMGEVEDDFIKVLLRLKKPIVYASARRPGMCHSVISNQVQSADQLVEHLVDLGHTTFAWLGGDLGRSRNAERKNAVSAALARHNCRLDPNAQIDLGEADRKEGFNAAKTILERAGYDPARRRKRKVNDRLPTAWICMTGLMARGAVNCLLQHGIEVGREISVVAFDVTRICTEEHPTITGAFALPEKLGEEAGRIIMAAADDSNFPLHEITLPSQLRIHESTGAPARRRASKPTTRKTKV